MNHLKSPAKSLEFDDLEVVLLILGFGVLLQQSSCTDIKFLVIKQLLYVVGLDHIPLWMVDEGHRGVLLLVKDEHDVNFWEIYT